MGEPPDEPDEPPDDEGSSEGSADPGDQPVDLPDDGAGDGEQAGDEPDEEPPVDGDGAEGSPDPDGPSVEPPADDADRDGDDHTGTDESDEEPPVSVADADLEGDPPEGPPPAADHPQADVDDRPIQGEADRPATPDDRSPLTRATDAKEPPDDVEMPLTDHIEEMLSRLVMVAVIGGLATAIAYPFAGDIVATMWYDIHPGVRSTCVSDPTAEGCTPPYIYGPLEFVLAEIKLAALAGIVVALPAVVYQTYQFMRPGLYPNERRYYLAAVPTSLVLAVVGMLFAYFLLLPILFEVFLYYSEGSAEIQFALHQTFDMILILMAVLAIVFQIPLFLILAIMMGVTTRRWLERHRLYFWAGFGGLAFLFAAVDPSGMAPIFVAATMIGLFEGTLLLLRWVGR